MKDVDQFRGIDLNPDNKEKRVKTLLLDGENLTGIKPDLPGQLK